jgi:hypothetical protein
VLHVCYKGVTRVLGLLYHTQEVVEDEHLLCVALSRGLRLCLVTVVRYIQAGIVCTFYAPVDCKRQEARGKRARGQEARVKRQVASGKRQEARGKRQETRGRRQEARGKRQEARGKRQEARGKRHLSVRVWSSADADGGDGDSVGDSLSHLLRHTLNGEQRQRQGQARQRNAMQDKTRQEARGER